jgi:glycosyltransferase involved in cell wall biosynthesis
MRLAVYTDYIYHRQDDVVYAERAFALFLAPLADQVERLVLIGRLGEAGEARYPLPPTLELAPLRHYGSLANPVSALSALALSLQSMWRALDGVDVTWVMGPYPHAIVLVLMAWVRRQKVVLGVRQDWPSYVRMRHPGRRSLHRLASLMEWIWRRLGSRFPVVVVGDELRRNYGHSPAVLDLAVSLVPAASVLEEPPEREYSSELRAMSVGRLDEEKNPLLLADIMRELMAGHRVWALDVLGEGSLSSALEERARSLGVSDRLPLLGYVSMGPELLELYRAHHALLHVSRTEGFPQVLIEAFAAGLPVVATAVGGVAAGVGDAALLIPPDDAHAAAAALARIADDPGLRAQLIERGLARARELTLEAQNARLLSFLRSASRRSARRRRRNS